MYTLVRVRLGVRVSSTVTITSDTLEDVESYIRNDPGFQMNKAWPLVHIAVDKNAVCHYFDRNGKWQKSVGF